MKTRAAALLLLFALLALPHAAHSLVFADATTEPQQVLPPDFPYWDHVTQRRYEGPTVIYLGAGWALTAKHVGRGEIFLDGRIVRPEARSRHTLLNADGSVADALVFELQRDGGLPDWPLLPIARVPPQVGEEVLLIGFGRLRKGRIEWGDPDDPRAGFAWNELGEKRWGTNRVETRDEWLIQGSWLTRSISMRFDPPDSPRTTAHEASATLGDSGGAVFVQRDGEWLLAGLMTSISTSPGTPGHTTTFGDVTYAADLSSYRDEIWRWTRPACSNGLDDDGDGDVDFPDDRNCLSATHTSEHPGTVVAGGVRTGIWPWVIGTLVAVVLIGAIARRRQRGRRTPASTSASTAD